MLTTRIALSNHCIFVAICLTSIFLLGQTVNGAQLTTPTTNSYLCNILQRQSKSIPSLDNFKDESVLRDFSFVSEKCDSGNANKTFEWDSGWIDVDSSSLLLNFDFPQPNSVTVSNARLIQSFSATIDQNAQSFNFNVSISFTFTLQFNLNRRRSSSISIDVFGSLGKSLENPIPWNSNVAYIATLFQGTMFGVSSDGQSYLSDANLFDGRSAAMLTSTSQNSQPPSFLMQLGEYVRLLVGDPNLRLSNFDSIPSSFDSTTRGSFLGITPQFAAENTVLGNLVELGQQQVSPSTTGLLYQATSTCDDTECFGNNLLAQQSIESSLLSFVVSMSNGMCADAQLIPGSFYAQTQLDVFVSNQSIIIRSLYSSTRAMYQCTSNPGAIGVAISTSSPNKVAFLSKAFVIDPNVATSMAQAIPIIPYGIASGQMMSSSVLFSVVEDQNLFGASMSGTLVPDVQLASTDLTTLTQAMTSVNTALKSITNLPTHLSNVVQGLFPIDGSSVKDLLNQYVSGTAETSSVLGFFNWYTSNVISSRNATLFVSTDENQDQTNITILFTLELNQQPLSDDDMSACNDVISELAKSIHTAYSDATKTYVDPSISTYAELQEQSQFSSFFTTSVTVVLPSIGSNAQITSYVASNVRFWSNIKAVVDFSSANTSLLFTSVNISLSYSSSNPDDITVPLASVHATVPSALQSTLGGSVVSLDRKASNGIALDQAWSSPQGFQQLLQNVSIILSQTSPLQINWVNVNGAQIWFDGTTVFDFLSNMSAILGSVPAQTTTSVIAQQLNDWVEQLSSNTERHLHQFFDLPSIDLLSESDKGDLIVRLNLTSFQYQSAPLSSVSWPLSADTSRLALPVVAITQFSVVLTSSGVIRELQISIVGGASSVGFTFPVSSGLRSGPLLGAFSSAELTLDIPASSSFVANMLVNTSHADLLWTTIEIDDLVSVDNTVTFNVEGALGDYQAALSVSSMVVSGIVENAFFGMLPSAMTTLSLPVPPIQDSLGAAMSSDFANVTSAMQRWLSSAPLGNQAATVVLSPTFCTAALQNKPISFNATVNGKLAFSCSLSSFGTPMTIAGVATTVQTQVLENCFDSVYGTFRLSDYLTTQVLSAYQDPSPQASTGQCGIITFVSAVPGIVTQYSAVASAQPLQLTSTFSSQLSPAFVTWNDWAALLNALRTMVFSLSPATSTLKTAPLARPSLKLSDDVAPWMLVDWTPIAVSDLGKLIPQELVPFYPPFMPAVAVPVELVSVAQHTFAMNNTLSAYEKNQLQIAFNAGASMSGTVVGNVSANIVTIFDAPNKVNISVLTNFDGSSSTINTTVVPAAPNNTFVMSVSVQIRNSSQPYLPTLVTFANTITLTPGALLSNELLTNLVPQLDPMVRSMVSVSVLPANIYTNPIAQIRMQLLNHLVVSSEIAMLGLSLGVNQTQYIVGLNDSYNSPVRVATYVRDFALNGSANLEIDQSSISQTLTGNIGFVGMQVGSAIGQTSFNFTVSMLNKYETVNSLRKAASTPARFFKHLNVTVHVDSTINTKVQQLTSLTDVQVTMPVIATSFKQQWDLTSVEALNNITTSTMPRFNVSFTSAPQPSLNAFGGMAQMGRAALCDWLRMGLNSSRQLTNKPGVSVALPFASHGFGHFITNSITNELNQLVGKMCPAQQTDYSLETFCTTLKNVFGIELCASASLSADGLLTILLEALYIPTPIVSTFRFDTPTFFKNSIFPVGFGTSATVNLNASVSFTLELLAKFSPSKEQMLAFSSASSLSEKSSSSRVKMLGTETPSTTTTNVELTRALFPIPSITLGPNTVFAASVNFDVQDDITANFGPLHVTLGDAHAWLNDTGVEYFPVTDQFQITGSAGINADFTFGSGQPYILEAQVLIPDVGKFLADPSGNFVFSSQEADFIADFLAALEGTTFLNILENPALFLQMWEGGVDEFLDAVFGPGGDLYHLIVPLIDQWLARELNSEIGNLIGPQFKQAIIADFTAIVNHFLATYDLTINRTLIDDILLEAFSGALCDILQPYFYQGVCPPSPQAPCINGHCKWDLKFGRQYTKPVINVSFDLGEAGLADFDLNCDLQLTMDWIFEFVLVYDNTKGIYITYPTSGQVFQADIDLSFNQGCEMDGNLAFMGAYIKPTVNQLMTGHLGIGAGFKCQLYLDATLQGTMHIGFAGPMADVLAHTKDFDNALDALPNWEMDVLMKWDFTLHNPVLTPTFKATNPQVCIGRLLTKVADAILAQAMKILGPLEPVLGPNGILLKPIPGLSDVFGHNLNLLQVLELMCEEDCGSQDAVHALEVVAQVIEDVSQIYTIAQWFQNDPEGCLAWTQVEDFIIRFEQGTVFSNSSVPNPHDVNFSPAFTGDKNMVATFYSHCDVTQNGNYGLVLNLFQNVPQKILYLIEGKSVPLAGISIPDFTLSAGLSYEIPIWPVPIIEIILGLDVGITFSLREIAMMSDGITRAVKTGSPSCLFEGIAIPVTNADGSMHYQITGTFKIYGGVAVSLIFIRGSASVSLTFNAMAGIKDVNGDGWMTFDLIFHTIEKYGVLAAIEVDFQLIFGFSLELDACVDLVFVHKCWKIASKEWHWTLAQFGPHSPAIPPVAFPAGILNLKIQSGSDLALYRAARNISDSDGPYWKVYTDTQTGIMVVDYTPVGSNAIGVAPHQTAKIYPTGDITATGGVDVPTTFQIWSLAQPFQVPDSANSDVSIYQIDFVKSHQFSITSQSIFTDIVPGVVFAGAISSVEMTDPLDELTYLFSSQPQAPITIDTGMMSLLQMNGDPSGYNKQPITITGMAQTAEISVATTDYTISSGSIISDAGNSGVGINLNIPSDGFTAFQSMDITGNIYQGTYYSLQSNPGGRDLTIHGGDGDDTVMVQDFSQLEASTTLEMGGGVNAMYVTVPTIEGTDLQVTATPVSLVRTSGSETNTILFDQVQRQIYTVQAAANTNSYVTILAPQGDTFLDLHTIGTPTSKVGVVVTGCGGSSEIRVNVTGGGDQVVELGQNGQLSNFLCTVRVDGSADPSQTITMILHAENDNRALIWNSKQEGSIVLSTADGSGWFNLFYENVNRIVIQFGSGGNDVEFAQSTVNTEFVFDFPTYQKPSAEPLNTLRVWKTNQAILVNGTYELNIGPTSAIQSIPPFASVTAPIVAIGASNINAANPIILNSATAPGSPPQAFVMNNLCLDPSPNTGLTSPSAWMCAQWNQNGIANCQTLCHLIYVDQVWVQIATGDASDSFIGTGVLTASVSVDLGAGIDSVQWSQIPTADSSGNENFNFGNFSLGPGADTLTVTLPVAEMYADLGLDHDEDLVYVYYNENTEQPNVDGTVIWPLGPYDQQDRLSLSDVFAEDELSVMNNGGANQEENQQQQPLKLHNQKEMKPKKANDVGDRMVFVNVSIPGFTMRYQVSSNTLYQVNWVAAGAEAAFDGTYVNPSPTNWNATVQLPAYDVTGTVVVSAVKGYGTVTSVVVPPSLPSMLAVHYHGTDGFRDWTIGGFRVQPGFVDHLLFTTQSVSTIVVDGVPDTSDAVLLFSGAAVSSTVQINSLINHFLVQNAIVTIPSQILTANVSVILTGGACVGSVDASFSQRATLIDSCLNTLPFGIPHNMPAFSDWLRSYVGSANLGQCAVQQVGRIDELDVNCPAMSASQLNLNHLVLLQDDATLILNDTTTLADHVLHLKGEPLISNFSSNIFLKANNPTVALVTVSMKPKLEPSPVQWLFNANNVQLQQNYSASNWITLNIAQLSYVQVGFSMGGNNVLFNQGTVGTEFVFQFPLVKPSMLTNPNSVRVISSTNTILINGTYDLSLGPEPTATTNQGPLDSLLGAIFASGGGSVNSSLQVWMNSTVLATNAPSNMFFLNGQCLSPQNQDGSFPSFTPITTWMCTQLSDNGLSGECTPCALMFVRTVSLNLATGNGKDVFNATLVPANTVSLNISLGAGNDWLVISHQLGTNGPTLGMNYFDVSTGADSVIIPVPIASSQLSLGDDQDVDLVQVWYDPTAPIQPNILGTFLTPVSPQQDSLNLLQVHPIDLLQVKRLPTQTQTQQSSIGMSTDNNTIVIVNITQPSTVTYDPTTSTTYRIVAIPDGATADFNTQSMQTPPTNWAVDVAVAGFTDAEIKVLSVLGTNVVVTFEVPSVTSVVGIQVQDQGGFKVLEIANKLRITPDQVDHMQIMSLFQSPVNVIVTNIPDAADFAFFGSSNSSVWLQNLNSVAFISNASSLIVNSSVLTTSNVSVLVAGVGSVVDLSLGWASNALLQNGCLNAIPTGENQTLASTASFSQWMNSTIENNGHGWTIGSCLFQQFGHLGTLQLSNINVVNASGIDLDNLLLPSTQTILNWDDSIHAPWIAATMSVNGLSVKPSQSSIFLVSLGAQSIVYCLAPVFSRQTLLSGSCGSGSNFQGTQWYFNSSQPIHDFLPSYVTWNASGCGSGLMSSSAAQPTTKPFVPSISFLNSAQIYLNVSLGFLLNGGSSIIDSGQASAVDTSGNDLFSVQYGSCSDVNLNVILTPQRHTTSTSNPKFAMDFNEASGSRTMTLNVDFAPDTSGETRRQVTVNQTSANFVLTPADTSTPTNLLVNWKRAVPTPVPLSVDRMRLLLTDAKNSLYLVGYPIQSNSTFSVISPSVVTLGNSTQLSLFTDNQSASIQFPNTSLTRNIEHSSLEPSPSTSVSSCIQPPIDCAPSAWEVFQMQQAECRNLTNDIHCWNAVAVYVQTSLPIRCPGIDPSDNGGWVLDFSMNQNDWNSVETYTWPKWFIAPLFFVFSAIDLVSFLNPPGTHLSPFPFSWPRLVITSCLSQINHFQNLNWDALTRSWLNAASQVVRDFTWGISCAGQSSDVTDILTYIVLGLSVISAILIILRIVEPYLQPDHRSKARMALRIVRKLVAGLVTLLLLPFFLTHVDLPAAIPIATVIFIVCPVFLFLVEYPYNKEKPLIVNRLRIVSHVVSAIVIVIVSRPDIEIAVAALFGLSVGLVVLDGVGSEALYFLSPEGPNRNKWSRLVRFFSTLCGILFVVLLWAVSSTPAGVLLTLWFIWLVIPPLEWILTGAEFWRHLPIIGRYYRSSHKKGGYHSINTSPSKFGSQFDDIRRAAETPLLPIDTLQTRGDEDT